MVCCGKKRSQYGCLARFELAETVQKAFCSDEFELGHIRNVAQRRESSVQDACMRQEDVTRRENGLEHVWNVAKRRFTYQYWMISRKASVYFGRRKQRYSKMGANSGNIDRESDVKVVFNRQYAA